MSPAVHSASVEWPVVSMRMSRAMAVRPFGRGVSENGTPAPDRAAPDSRWGCAGPASATLLRYDVAGAPGRLGLVHRDVGRAQQLVARGALRGGDADADAGRQRDGLAVQIDRRAHLLLDALGDARGPARPRHVLGEHDELVPAEAC